MTSVTERKKPLLNDKNVDYGFQHIRTTGKTKYYTN
jgi:hypothetical protein